MKANKLDMSRWTVGTLTEAGAVMGVSARTLQDYCRKGCPGRKGSYNVPAMIEWAKEHVWKPRPVPIDDPMLAGGNSPSLERYRAARAAQEEIKLAHTKAEFVPRENLRLLSGAISLLIREMTTNLERQFGSSVHDVVNDALVNAEHRVSTYCDANDLAAAEAHAADLKSIPSKKADQ